MKPFVKAFFLIILLCQGLTARAQNQVVVNAVVLPPYTTQLSDYTDNPNKLQVNFINTTTSDLEVYIQGSVTGDNGISISTDPSFIMPAPVVLQPGVPYRLEPGNLQDLFSADHLVFSGISRNELLRSGTLPEGNYQFCFRVYDYRTHQLLSNDQAGCSNFLQIIYQDPPVITYPVCGSEVEATQPQNLLISWTPSVGSLPNVHYRLIMVEMHPSDRSPMDALMSANPGNYFIEAEDLTVPQLYIGSTYPQLNKGYKYAFFVQAYDPDNKIVFNNNGTSEVCWFTYKAPKLPELSVTTPAGAGVALKDYLDDFAMLPATRISGRLLYMMAGDARMTGAHGTAQAMVSAGKDKKWNQRNRQNSTPSAASGTYYGSAPASGNDANTNHFSLNNYQYFTGTGIVKSMNLPPPLGTGVTDADLFSTNGGKPLGNMRVKLVARLLLKDLNGPGVTVAKNPGLLLTGNYRFYDVGGNVIPMEKVKEILGRTFAVATTDDNGHYTFDFRQDFFTGPFISVYDLGSSDGPTMDNFTGYIALKLEVENLKFCSPDINIFALPGDQLQLPDQLALIRDYSLDIVVTSGTDSTLVPTPPKGQKRADSTLVYSYDVHPKVIPGKTPIPGVKVRILRDMQKMGNEHKAILLAEGSQDGKIISNANGRFKVVLEGVTDQKGKIHVGHLVEYWEQVDGKNGSPYYYSAQTRADHPENEMETSDKNFGTKFGQLKDLGFFRDIGNNNKVYYDRVEGLTYNVQYVKENRSVNTFEIGMTALPPEIKGHLMAATNLENIGLSGIRVWLYNKNDPGRDDGIILTQKIFNGRDWIPDISVTKIYHREQLAVTNKAGFFRLRNLPVRTDNSIPGQPVATGPYRRIQIDSRLYKRIVWPPLDKNPYNLVYGDLKYLKLQLEPKHLLSGKVVNEQGDPVPAYLRLLPNSPYVKTERNWDFGSDGIISFYEAFTLPVAETNNDIEVIPLSNQYFADTIHLSGIPDKTLRIVVKKKLHRLVLRVKDRNTGKGIAGARVIAGDSLAAGTTNDLGNILLEFPSPGQQFTFSITAGHYAPVQKVFTLPVSSRWTRAVTVYLSPAKSIRGTITDKKTRQPIENALVYTELQNTGGQSLYLEARSDAKGFYILKGVPSQYKTLTVHVVKEGKEPAYVGVEKNITLADLSFTGGRLSMASYDFALEPLDAGLADIWGFPAVIEKVTRENGRITAVSGYLYDLPGKLNLQMLNKDGKIYFDNLKVEIQDGALRPAGSSFYTQRHTIPVKLNGGFSGDLTNQNGMFTPPLMVEQKNGKAYIKGILKLDLSSFKFAYDFHGDLYLGDDTLQAGIRVFDAFHPPMVITTRKYYVFDLYNNGSTLRPLPIRDYKIFGFRASSDLSHSYYQTGMIHIGTTLHTAIPLPNGSNDLDLKIRVGDVIITRDNIRLETSRSAFTFDLEKWKVTADNNWYFDKNRDAIVLSRATIQTGLGINAAVKSLLIRPDALREGQMDLSRGLSLGGVVPLTVAPGLKPVFNYDAGVGHYRISMTGSSDKPAAWVDHLPALEGRLEFLSVDLLSDNTTETGIGKTFRFHHLIDVFVDQVASGNNSFTLVGMPEMGVPKMITGQAHMTYYKENGQLRFRMEPLNTKVDCNANMLFVLDQERTRQKLQDRLYTAYGRFKINPPAGEPGEPFYLTGQLVKKPEEVYINVQEQDIKMGKETMHVDGGRITATGHAWNELHFSAYTRSKGMSDKNKLDFVVHGGIEANGDKIEVNNIKTPFGNFEMAYLFPQKALTGHLTINTPISTGYATLFRGMMDMRFDPDGFYFGINALLNIDGIPMEGGMIVGDYDASMEKVNAAIFAHMHKKPVSMPNFSGFYFIGEAPLLNFKFPLAKVITVKVEAGLGAYVGMNFSNNTEVIGGGYGYADGKGGVNIEPCGFIGVENNNFLNMEMQYLNGNVSFCSCGTSKYSVGACGLNASVGLLTKYRISTDGDNEKVIKLSSSSCPSALCNH